MVKNTILFIIFSLFILTGSFAQNRIDTSKTADQFRAGLNLFTVGKYAEAQQLFNGIINNYAYNPQTTISYIFEGKCLVKLKKYASAENLLNKFESDYFTSKYIEEARLTLADCYYEQGKYLQAFKKLNEIIASSSSPFYSSYAQSTGRKIALGYLNADDIKALYDSTQNQRLKPYLLLLTGRFYVQNYNLKAAENTLSDLLHLYPESEEKSEAATLYQKVLNEQRTTYTTPIIGVMLPLDSLNNSIHSNAAGEILEGIKYAVAVYNKNHNPQIGLLIRNTGSDSATVDKIENEFSGIASLKAVIGPIFSNEVKEALKVFKSTNIPIISPTATENNLTDLYPYFFQANPSFAVRGKVMAEYIYYVENKRRMAVFNANQGYSPALADAFIEEFEKLGGQIIIRQTYNSDSVSYSQQVNKIAADSTQLQGIYLPLANRRDVPVLLSQFVLSDLTLPIYGNQDWFLARGYETSSTLSNSLTFSSDFFINYADSTFQAFNRNFLAQTNINVDRNVLYGFDTANYLLNAVKDFNSPRDTIISDLESGFTYQGFHNNYSFGKDRINNFLNIVRYRDGRFELVDKFKFSR